jgi:hypothetical protein
MRDIFGIESAIGGAWSLDGAVLEIGPGDDNEEGLVVTSVDITYQRQSQKFTPLNQNKMYMAMGEADGRMDLGLVIGPSTAIRDFLENFSKACNIRRNVISVKPVGLRYSTGEGTDCDREFPELTFTCSGCIINNIRISVRQSGGALTLITGGIGLQFMSMAVQTGVGAVQRDSRLGV